MLHDDYDRDRGRPRNTGDFLLNGYSYVYIQDGTTGDVKITLGPKKDNITDTDVPVVLKEDGRGFRNADLKEAINGITVVPEGFYVTLKNPHKDGIFPEPGKSMSVAAANLLMGQKVNLPGPFQFAPWPGQISEIIRGHRIRTDQYLIVRVYDAKAAAKEDGIEAAAQDTQDDDPNSETTEQSNNIRENLALGAMFVIKGSDVSFYIPPTGIEVVANSDGERIRDAVTLEQLEYCILLDENGQKRYEYGPMVVYPTATETFMEVPKTVRDDEGNKTGSIQVRKFKALELSSTSGIHIRVIEEYTKEETTHKVGEEIFITGDTTPIYYPRPEHAVVQYGSEKVIFAVAISEGEARYVLNRETGETRLVRGPEMCLPNPIEEVLLRRVLTADEAALWYPGNKSVEKHNASLRGDSSNVFELGEESEVDSMMLSLGVSGSNERRMKSVMASSTVSGVVGDRFHRKTTFTKPRILTLNSSDTKFDGAVRLNVHTGYAIKVVSPDGASQVVVGPKSHLLDYADDLEIVEFSTGTPKDHSRRRSVRTVYLCVANNGVSDSVTITTKDGVDARINIRMRVNFDMEQKDLWFNEKNYIKLLTDRVRSVIRDMGIEQGISDLYARHSSLVKDVLIGKETDGNRPGMTFSSNGMIMDDVEVTEFTILDNEIRHSIISAQQKSLQYAITDSLRKQELENLKSREEHVQETIKIEAETVSVRHENELSELELTHTVKLEQLKRDQDRKLKSLEDARVREAYENETRQKDAEAMSEIRKVELATDKADTDFTHSTNTAEAELRIAESKAASENDISVAKAISDRIAPALERVADSDLLINVTKDIAPMALVEKTTITGALERMLGSDSVLSGMFKRVTNNVRKPYNDRD